MRLRILHHGSCFDGASSAGVFEPVEVMFTPMDHKEAGPAIPPDLLDGEVNACVDFRYTSDPRLHWWFDHHASTFQSAEGESTGGGLAAMQHIALVPSPTARRSPSATSRPSSSTCGSSTSR